MTIATSKTCGKLMLLGDHAVVYGYPCISASVDKYIYVEISKIDAFDKIETQEYDQSFVKEALGYLRKEFNKSDNYFVKTVSELGKYGLGSSAAVTVGIVNAFLKLYSINKTNDDIFKLCFEIYRKIQPQASGFDLATSIYKGTVLFNGKTKRTKRIIDSQLPIIAIFTGRKADSPSLIKMVADKYQKDPKNTEKIFSKLGELAIEGEKLIVNNNWKELGEVFNKSQQLLKKLGVSNEKIDEIIISVLKAGAMGIKISGAGGGDCIIALVDSNNREKVISAAKKAKGEVLDIKLGIAK